MTAAVEVDRRSVAVTVVAAEEEAVADICCQLRFSAAAAAAAAAAALRILPAGRAWSATCRGRGVPRGGGHLGQQDRKYATFEGKRRNQHLKEEVWVGIPLSVVDGL